MVVARSLGHGFVECLGQFRIVAVVLSPAAVLHKANELELAAVQLWERLGMHREGLVRQLR